MAQCRSPKCRAKIIWGVEETTNKRIPLDASAPVYKVIEWNRASGDAIIERAENHYVTHFKTCPDASFFSRNNKKGGSNG